MSLWPSSWPAEDGGPRRSQAPAGGSGLRIGADERLVTAAVRDAFATTMVVLREPGEVFLLRHTLGRRPLRDPMIAWVERVDPLTLAPLHRSRISPPDPSGRAVSPLTPTARCTSSPAAAAIASRPI